MKASKKVRPHPFTVIVNESVAREIETPEPSVQPDCMSAFRIEVKSSKGSFHYPIRANDKIVARQKAKQFVVDMAFAYQEERIAWRMAGDKNWTFNGAEKEKKSLLRKIGEYFFGLEEEIDSTQTR